ncbi:phage tail tape measure protein [Actinoplanes teichomyceticus]|nr:phage tail tape measure protein [Actinoplanes teichomyceticus]
MARTVTVKIGADVTDFRAKLRGAGQSMREFRGEMAQAARAGHLDEVADQAARLGTVGVAAFGGVVMASARFEKAMSGVNAATHASGREMQMLRDAALEAGKATSYSATEAAAAETELAKAGVTVRDIIGGGLSGALSLAAAGQMDVAESAEIAASAMTQFKLKGADIPHIADLLAAGAGKAQGNVHDMGAALNQAGLVASQMGLSVEDTTGVLAAFASAGLMGSDSGTSLKTALLMLANPTDKARSLMEELGIQVYDASGKFVGVTKLAGSLKSQLGTLTQEQRNSALATIFGSDAIRAASVLYEQGASGIQTWIDKVDDQGYAADTARRQTDNLIGDLERLQGSLETLAIENGSGANGGLRMLAQGANAAVDQISELPPMVGQGITVLAGLGGAVLLLGAGWVKARRSTAAALDELRATGPVGTRAASGLQRVAGAAGKVAGAFVALQAADAVIGQFQKDLNPQAEALAAGLGRYAQSGQLAGEASRLLGGDLSKLDGQFQILADSGGKATWARGLQSGLESLIPGLDGTEGSLAKTRERVTALDQALSQMVQGGQADQAKVAFTNLSRELATNGVSMEEFRAQFPAYAAALEVSNGTTADATAKTGELGGALQSGTSTQKEYTSAVEASAAAVRGERSALNDLAKQLKSEADPVFGFLDAQQKLTEAQKASAEAVKKHGKNSAEAKEATRNLALAAIELEGRAGALGQTFDGEMTPALRSTLRAAGLSERQISGLAGQFRQAKEDGDEFAGRYKADVSLSGYGGVTGQLDKLLIYQQALKKGISVSAAASAFNKNARPEFHAGGWTGPGGKYEPAGVVHADEFVIRKEARQKIEAANPGLLDEMNATGQVRGYATGGLVLPFPASVAGARIPSRAEVAKAVGPVFDRDWPSSPGAQRGDSGVWHKIVQLIKSTGPLSGEFGNAFRPGDPKWHGSGRAVDWMGYEQDALASFLASKRPLELIHRTKSRDYAYTRGVNKGSFNAALMEAHRNHIHVAMANGGVINEHVIGYGRSGATYEFGEAGPERVTPLRGYAGGGYVNVAPTTTAPTGFRPTGTRLDYLESLLAARSAVSALTAALKENGRTWSTATAKGRDNRSALIAGV